ncbi:hypothetical protein SAMN04487895_11670 [Paenibacillus sophorae]|uniref:Uncharacterized protein n=1 Tax=Paenibacillus sophorae TaxID=1333845 RepID=A0A1H8U7A9_9BACL|nr:hypothetical protein [Paenibacillus sophorae]QWU17978.1 hypothetical protein KP014_13090 [Paenibacillus sophorae]SEO98966.1 hypothetical protein SAMN04487895_11670 [Paenibacillus sophorae]
MLSALQGEKVTIYFLDGSCLSDGVLEKADEKFIKYKTEYQIHYVPVSSVRSVALDTKERQRPRMGFGQ